MILFSINSDRFKHQLDLASKAADIKSDTFLLGYTLLESSTKDQDISLSSFNGSEFIKIKFDSEVENDCKIAIQGNIVSATLSKLKNQSVAFELQEKADNAIALSLKSESADINFACIRADDYPSLPIKDEDFVSFSLDLGILRDGLINTLFAASAEISKQILTGVNLKSTQNDSLKMIKFAATDSHRLSVATIALESDIPEFDITVASTVLSNLISLTSEYSRDIIVDIGFSESFVKFDIQGRSISSPILNGSYPAYAQLIPQRFDILMTCDRKKLIDALDLIAIAAQKNNYVEISYDTKAGELILSGESKDVCTAIQRIEVDSTFESELAIAFNIKYLLSGLKSMNCDEIVIQANKPGAPVVILPVDSHIATEYLVMPVQLRR